MHSSLEWAEGCSAREQTLTLPALVLGRMMCLGEQMQLSLPCQSQPPTLHPPTPTRTFPRTPRQVQHGLGTPAYGPGFLTLAEGTLHK